ncbi:unnamed protein product, partial [Urochloa humidicola]
GDRVQHRTGVGCRQLGSLRPGTAGGQGGRPRLGAANGRSGKAVGSVAGARCNGDLVWPCDGDAAALAEAQAAVVS